MLANIKDILIIVNKGQLNQYKKIIPDGKNLGIKITYLEQDKPRGLPDAFVIGEKFIAKSNAIILFFTGKHKLRVFKKSTKTNVPISYFVKNYKAMEIYYTQ